MARSGVVEMAVAWAAAREAAAAVARAERK